MKADNNDAGIGSISSLAAAVGTTLERSIQQLNPGDQADDEESVSTLEDGIRTSNKASRMKNNCFVMTTGRSRWVKRLKHNLC